MVRKTFAVTVLMIVIISMLSMTVLAASYNSWAEVVNEMEAVVDKAYDIYLTGEIKAAKDQVDVAYYGYYEKLGFEKTVMAYISGNRAATVEYQFSYAKKAMTAGSSNDEVRAMLDELVRLLREDANQLDGKNESAISVFLGSLLIITREGFEAIIIVGAIIAYLVKSGNKDKTRSVYWGSLVALGASVIMAIILNSLTAASGANQEIIEGVTMLIAVGVLFYVSNWMVSKAEAAQWTRYIEGKVQSSITTGSVFSLALAAFLAVFREGAETILFYQALLAGTQTYFNMVWIGLAVGCALLVVIYLLIRFMSIRLPLKPFFLGTSILLFVMSISFVGAGIKELQEGNIIGVTPVSGITSIDILGIYPTLETLIPQIVLLLLTVGTFMIQMRKWKKARAANEPAS
ncbi:MAG: FTR1 family iron permease [Clostridiales bacterium]|jgi:high-affinity iron transporter|nr:FTR1 family iron permease [Clostridiales bacterium]